MLLAEPGRRVTVLLQNFANGGVLRSDDAEPLLIGKNLFAHGVPAHVELSLELVDPFLGGLMRSVGAAGHVIKEEGFIGRSRALIES